MISSRTDPITANRDFGKLRNQLFLSSALLSSAILVVAAWVINNKFVTEARGQVQAEVETLLPLYDAIWNERARRLGTVGTTIANSPIVKAVFGDTRASRDRQTLREMIRDTDAETATNSPERDLILISDGAGQVIFAEQKYQRAPELEELHSARSVGENQVQQNGFVMLGNRLYQLVLTPLALHSGNAEVNNTLASIGVGAELDQEGAIEIKRRIHSDVVFFVGNNIHASSFDPE